MLTAHLHCRGNDLGTVVAFAGLLDQRRKIVAQRCVGIARRLHWIKRCNGIGHHICCRCPTPIQRCFLGKSALKVLSRCRLREMVEHQPGPPSLDTEASRRIVPDSISQRCMNLAQRARQPWSAVRRTGLSPGPQARIPRQQPGLRQGRNGQQQRPRPMRRPHYRR